VQPCAGVRLLGITLGDRAHTARPWCGDFEKKTLEEIPYPARGNERQTTNNEVKLAFPR
jgi:hypothetical protein